MEIYDKMLVVYLAVRTVKHMLGDSMIPWFNLFNQIIFYSEKGEWVNINEFTNTFYQQSLKLEGVPIQKGDGRDEELTNAVIEKAAAFCELGLLDRNRGLNPPRLEYRISPKGKKFGELGRTKFGRFRQKLFFFTKTLQQLLKKRLWPIVAIGAFFMAIVNAVKFYSLALTWGEEIAFQIASLIVLVVLAVLFFTRNES
ncbi:hypothetical protein [Neptuniibacter sp. QD57_21]|uniref:hypothetical protein n=1 Tax=Neptuniibacter sp. QD57_21 TaxID=3398213 RepID=UPI0039F5C201